MRVFITGATGFIGTATIRELLANGHSVLGLARSPASIQKLASLGVSAHPGSIEDFASLTSGAAQCDAVIHLAFHHDFPAFDFAASCAKDRAAIETLGTALEGTDKLLIVTSGILLLKQGDVRDEEDAHDGEGFGALRGASEDLALGFVDRGVKAMVVRLPPTVHGEADKGFITMLIQAAREQGEAFVVSKGENRWTAVHRCDAARLYRLALEKGRAGGVYHAVAEESLSARCISETIAKSLRLGLVERSLEDAETKMGFVAAAFALDVPAMSKKTREELGWESTEVGLLDDMESVYLK